MKLNLQVFLNSYNDSCQTSTPMLSNFKWNREVNGVPFTAENSQMLVVPPSGTVNLLTSDTKTFLYVDTDQSVSVIYNGGGPITVAPFQINGKLQPGVFMITGAVVSLSITNPGTVAANVFFAAMG